MGSRATTALIEIKSTKRETTMTDLIDRAALVAFMERVLRNLTADELASDAYLRGYRQAMTDVQLAATVRPATEAEDA